MRAFVFLLLVWAAPVYAQLDRAPSRDDAIHLLETWVDAQRAYQEIPGASMAVVHDQEVVWAGGVGFANRERELPAGSQTVYSICSISKLFTSIGVMQLRDAGRVHLDDPVSRHLDWFTIGESFPGDPPVSVEGLLTHSSGLPRESDYPYWTEPDFPFPDRDAIMQRVREQEELYEGRSIFQYSNLGLTLAGEVVQAASGRDFHEYVRDEILSPLGMTSTYSDIPLDLRGDAMAVGYSAMTRRGVRDIVPPFETRGIAPAAGFASTVEDLARFAAWQFRTLGGELSILAPNTLKEMHRVHWLDPDWSTAWGLGFSVWRHEDEAFVGHGGSCPGYRSQLALHPRDRIAIVFMSNAGGVDTRNFITGAYDILAPALKEDRPAGDETDELDVSAYVGTYSASPWGGEEAVVPWKGGLAVMNLPTSDPMEALAELRPVGPHRFRRVRANGDLAEEIRFDIGEDGTATRMWQHSNFSRRIQP